MKLGLISDIHGDPLALELAWSHLTVLGADRIVSAGDLVGYGPFPDRSIAFLESRKIAAVRGNHDRWALERGPGRADEFGEAIPSAVTLSYLASLPVLLRFAIEGRTVVVAHGSPSSDMEYIAPKSHPADVLDEMLEALDADVLVHGHTHAPMRYRGTRGLVVNPGSVVSMPVVRSSRTFAMVDLATLAVTFHDVETGKPLDVPSWPGGAAI